MVTKTITVVRLLVTMAGIPHTCTPLCYLRPLPACVYMSIRLSMFSSYYCHHYYYYTVFKSLFFRMQHHLDYHIVFNPCSGFGFHTETSTITAVRNIARTTSCRLLSASTRSATSTTLHTAIRTPTLDYRTTSTTWR